MFERVQETFPVYTGAVADYINTTKKSNVIIRNFIKLKKRWPTCKLSSSHAHPTLVAAKNQNLDPYTPNLISKYGTFKNSDWVRVHMGKEVEFMKVENIISLVKDKAISLIKQNLHVPAFALHLLLKYILKNTPVVLPTTETLQLQSK